MPKAVKRKCIGRFTTTSPVDVSIDQEAAVLSIANIDYSVPGPSNMPGVCHLPEDPGDYDKLSDSECSGVGDILPSEPLDITGVSSLIELPRKPSTDICVPQCPLPLETGLLTRIIDADGDTSDGPRRRRGHRSIHIGRPIKDWTRGQHGIFKFAFHSNVATPFGTDGTARFLWGGCDMAGFHNNPNLLFQLSQYAFIRPMGWSTFAYKRECQGVWKTNAATPATLGNPIRIPVRVHTFPSSTNSTNGQEIFPSVEDEYISRVNVKELGYKPKRVHHFVVPHHMRVKYGKKAISAIPSVTSVGQFFVREYANQGVVVDTGVLSGHPWLNNIMVCIESVAQPTLGTGTGGYTLYVDNQIVHFEQHVYFEGIGNMRQQST